MGWKELLRRYQRLTERSQAKASEERWQAVRHTSRERLRGTRHD